MLSPLGMMAIGTLIHQILLVYIIREKDTTNLILFAFLFISFHFQERYKRGVSNRPNPVTPTIATAFTSNQKTDILKAHQAATVFMWATLQKLVIPNLNFLCVVKIQIV